MHFWRVLQSAPSAISSLAHSEFLNLLRERHAESISASAAVRIQFKRLHTRWKMAARAPLYLFPAELEILCGFRKRLRCRSKRYRRDISFSEARRKWRLLGRATATNWPQTHSFRPFCRSPSQTHYALYSVQGKEQRSSQKVTFSFKSARALNYKKSLMAAPLLQENLTSVTYWFFLNKTSPFHRGENTAYLYNILKDHRMLVNITLD